MNNAIEKMKTTMKQHGGNIVIKMMVFFFEKK